MMIESLSSAHATGAPTPVSRKTSTSPLIRLIPLALFAVPVFADDAGPAAPAETAPAGLGQLQEVVVTAEKRSETIQATPISVSALTDVQLERQNITNLEQLAGSVPGISMRTAGPGQTEYEMRGLTSAGGSTATVGFYLDETPLSANAVALNGRTVIDPDLFDLNHVEVLRGPQGTLYGAGSMGGTIKLVTNQPQLGKWEAATDLNTSHTDSGGSWNAGGSVMFNVPIGDIVALRFVGTDKYVSGWLNRYIYGASFPFPTVPNGTPLAMSLGCFEYYCKRGDLQDLTPEQVVDGVNLERFSSARAILLVKPSDKLSVTTTLMYQRIITDGFNEYQATGDSPDPYPSTPGVYQPYNQPEPYSDQFKLASLDLVYDFGPATMTFAPAYFQRWVIQSQDSTEPLQNINDLTQFLQSLFQEGDLTTQDSLELRLASNGTGPFQWQGGIFGSDLHSTYNGYEQNLAYATALTCGYPGATSYPVAGHCMPAVSTIDPASNNCVASNIPGMFQDCVFNSYLRFPNASLPPYPNRVAANPNGVIFNDHNPNVMKQWAIFGESSYKLLEDLKLTAGIRFFRFTIDNHAEQAGLGTASGNQDPTIIDSSSSGSAVLPKLNLSYTPTPDLTLYGTISKGSRPGGVNLPIPIPTLQELEANPAAYNCNVPLANQLNPSLPVPPGSYVATQPKFGPDSVWSYELGEKWRFDEQRFTINGDVYYIKWTNIQQVVSLSCGYPADINAGNAQAYGPEIETSTRITDGLTFNLSYAYTHAVINDPNATAQAGGFFPGIRIINVPKYTAIASLDYVHPLTDTLNGVFHITSSLVGPILDQAYYREELSSHNLIDMRAGVTGGQWAAYLTGTNLTNKVAELTIDNTVFAWQQPTITRVSTNQPRTIGVDFQYRF